ncbi:MAG: cell surface protein SprA, partial [Gemmatimonadetes bacterium]
MQLNVRFELKADQFRNLRCSAIDLQQALSGCAAGFPTISPNPQYSIRSGGVVGQRLHLNVDFDSQREFDANNNLQVWYEGLEDEPLRRVEAGNVTFQAPRSRFISAAIPANNFGVQAIAQFGALELRGIYAQQKGNVVMDRVYTIGDVTTQPIDREGRDLDYEAGRFFFAVDPAAIPGYPAVDILSLEATPLPAALRVGGLHVYRMRAVSPLSSSNQNIGGLRAVACGPGAQPVDCGAERAGPFQWEVLQEGRDYYADPSGAWFALASRLDQSDYLAVSYIPVGETSCSSGRCVGTFPVTARPDPSFVDTLRLVYDPRPGVTAATPSFRFEIRSAYRVGGSEVTRETVTLALTVNRRERTVAADETYLARLGLALVSDANVFDQYNRLFPRTRDPLQGAPVRDYFVVFPHLTPFADPAKLDATERNDSLYRTPRALLATQGPPSVFALRMHASVSASADRGLLSLNSFQIRDGSERIYVGTTLLTRGTDYTIDYATGQVQFRNPDALFPVGGVAQVRAQFEERAAFVVSPTSIFGLAGRYDLGARGTVNFTGLFQREQSAFTRPPLGSEPASTFIGGVSTELHFRPAWITRALAKLPGIHTDAPSFLNVSAEIAMSRPGPNPAGQAYIEEFEGEAGRFLSLAEQSWHWGSVPSTARGAESFGIAPGGFAFADAAALTWQNLPSDPSGRPMQFLPQQIDPTIRLVGQGQSAEPVLWLMLKPDTLLGLANSRTGAPNWVRPHHDGPRWRAITQVLSPTGIDLSRVEFLELWVWEDNHRVAKAANTALLLDFGSVFEDALAFVPETLTVTPQGDTVYSGDRAAGLGRLDTERDPLTHSWSATQDDEGILSDRIVDGIWDATQGRRVDTLPLCSARVNGALPAYAFGDLRSRCGRHNGAVDTEDQDGDFLLDSLAGVKTREDFARFVFPIGDDRYFVRDGGMVAVRDSFGNPDGASGWRLYRIPFRTDTLEQGSVTLRQIQSLRVTIVTPQNGPLGRPDPQVFFGLARVRLVGATWVKRADTPIPGLAGDRGSGTGEVIAAV